MDAFLNPMTKYNAVVMAVCEFHKEDAHFAGHVEFMCVLYNIFSQSCSQKSIHHKVEILKSCRCVLACDKNFLRT